MNKYKSKIGVGIGVYIAIILGGTSYVMVADRVWFGLMITLAVAVFSMYVLLSTYYIIDGYHLIIRSGFMYRKSIDIHNIRRIEETNNPLSSPAASLDRIAVYFNKYDKVMISPKEKMDFIKHLTMINEGIEVVLKKDKKR